MLIKARHLQSLLDIDLMTVNPFLTSDMNVSQARICAQREALLKKFRGKINGKKADTKTPALELFDKMNEYCKSNFRPNDGNDYYFDMLSDAQHAAEKCLMRWDGPVFTLADAIEHGLPGPGTSAGVKGTDFASKLLDGDITVSEQRIYDKYIAFVGQRWRSMEMERLAMQYKVIETESEVFTVPKNSTIDRVAMKEPSLNMFIQKGIGSLLEVVLKKKFNISLKTQPNLNRLMAKIGSETGRFATIDLRSASDTISTSFIKWLLPKEIYEQLNFVRSKRCDRGELNMISTMGNGFTFPLQTLVFSILVSVVYRELRLPFRELVDGLPTWSVFGDDIVVVSEAYDTLVGLLTRCGFIVNSEKSYNKGDFRESCGRDYFKGHNIRGVYIKDLKHAADIYSSFNRLMRWSLRNGIAIPRTLQYLKNGADFRPVPFDTGDTAGFHWPRSLVCNRKVDSNGAEYYRALRPVNSSRRTRLGPAGKLTVALGGYLIGSDRIGLRQNNPCWRVVREKTPSWDFIPYAGLTIRDYTCACLVSLHT